MPIVQPMLAQEFSKCSQSVEYPVLAQPKLDGVRLVAGREGRHLRLRTRTGKEVPPGAFGGLASMLAELVPPGVFLDGEMYSNTLSFESIASAFKHGSTELQYHVYDLYDANRPHLSTRERLAALSALLTSCTDVSIAGHGHGGTVTLVQTYEVPSEAAIMTLHDKFAAQGYEGIMLRAPGGAYEPGKRSRNLLKLKRFHTDEYRIVDVVQAQGKDAGTAVFVCEIQAQERTFRVRMRGSREVRRQIWLSRSEYIGKQLTVRFQELTAYGVPRFPVGLAIRDYE
jgi:ATP-dependent DNA ligase